MKKIMRYTLILTFFTQINLATAEDFTHFTLKGSLAAKQDFQKRKATRVGSIMNKKSPNYSPLLQEISNLLINKYEDIGASETQDIIDNHNAGGGVLNFSGFSWHKPMPNYNISANREVAPELFSNRWIVHDSFTIFIEASTLITRFKNNKLLNISDKAFAAFAGVSFSRKYSYYHFTDSYLEGLTSDFSKLFLSFTKFSPQEALKIQPFDILKRSDSFSFNAGGLVKLPLGSGFGLEAGALIKKSYENELTLQGVSKQEGDSFEFLRLSIDRAYDISAKAQLSIQLDFFNLLKLTLLEGELEYQYALANKTYLSFNLEDKDTIKTEPHYAREFKQLLNANDHIKYWENNIVSTQRRTKENFNSKYSFLLFGTMKKRATEQIKIIRDGIEKVFFKHYSESVKYIQSWSSRLFSSVIFKIFNFPTTIKNRSEVKKQLIIEYEHMKELGPGRVDTEKKFSIRLKYFFHVASTHKWYQRRFKNSARRYVQRFTTLPGEISRRIKKKKLRGPLTIHSTIEIETTALEYFNQLGDDYISDVSMDLCDVDSSRRQDLFSARNIFETRQVKLRGKDHVETLECAEKLISRYRDYIKALDRFNEIDLMKVKKFLGFYFSKARSLSDIMKIFGEENVFIHGDFRAKTKKNKVFQTFFKTGLFRGLGVINNFKQETLIIPIDTRRND